MRILRFIAPLVLCCSAGVLAHADSFSAVGSFCPSQPCNSFSYGTIIGGVFVPFDTYAANYIGGGTVANVNSYYSSSSPSLPTVANYTGSGAYLNLGTANIVKNLLLLHPGSSGNPAVVRFTAPTAGLYSISGIFQGLDFARGATTDVTAGGFYGGGIVGYGYAGDPSHAPYGPAPTLTFSSQQALTAGQTVDFAVGFGQDLSYQYDSTGFNVTISAVPEPSAIILMGTMLLLVVFQARRRFVR